MGCYPPGRQQQKRTRTNVGAATVACLSATISYLPTYSDDNSDERNREDCCRASRFCLGQVGRRMLVDDLLKFNTPDTFLKAVLCLQCASGLPAVRSVPVATS